MTSLNSNSLYTTSVHLVIVYSKSLHCNTLYITFHCNMYYTINLVTLFSNTVLYFIALRYTVTLFDTLQYTVLDFTTLRLTSLNYIISFDAVILAISQLTEMTADSYVVTMGEFPRHCLSNLLSCIFNLSVVCIVCREF